MRLSFVDLPELLFVVNFDPYAILEYILDMLLPLDLLAKFIFCCDYFLKVRRMTPSNLDCRWCLSHMCESSRQETVLLNLGHILLDGLLQWVVITAVLFILNRGYKVVHRTSASRKSWRAISYLILLIGQFSFHCSNILWYIQIRVTFDGPSFTLSYSAMGTGSCTTSIRGQI